MKKILSIGIAVLVMASACKKLDKDLGKTSNLYLFHGAYDAGRFRLNPGGEGEFIYQWFSGYPFEGKYQMGYGEYKRLAVKPGPRVITAVKDYDTLITLFEGSFDFSKPVNSLFVIGDHPNIETVFVSGENIPFIDRIGIDGKALDSSMYIRFINMSPDAGAVKFMFKDSTEQVTDLTYKEISEFKKYAALKNAKTFRFEVRDVATNTTLKEIEVNPNDVYSGRFNSISLILLGRVGQPSFELRRIGYYDVFY